MKTISIINLKGGVGKSISAINLAHILATRHGKRVLLVDNDKQGNTTKFFLGDSASTWAGSTIAQLLTERNICTQDSVARTRFENLHLIGADMNLIKANMQLLYDAARSPQTRLAKALEQVSGQYDFCIIDNAPDIALNTINALIASNHVLIPVKLDQFAMEGLEILVERIAEAREDYNSGLSLLGCFLTMHHNERGRDNQQYHLDAMRELERITQVEPFAEYIMRSPKVDESTFAHRPIVEFSRGCAAARGYIDLAESILKRIERA